MSVCVPGNANGCAFYTYNVVIPDTNFGIWLSGRFGGCIQWSNSTGWEMDTTCPAIVTATNICICTYNNSQIKNLSGIQYFDNLKTLRCENGTINNIPALPNSLTQLTCYDNQLSSLPVLPNSLTSLNCSYNQLTSLPSLPASLIELDCNGNQLQFNHLELFL
jgi:hypothetical protein